MKAKIADLAIALLGTALGVGAATVGVLWRLSGRTTALIEKTRGMHRTRSPKS